MQDHLSGAQDAGADAHQADAAAGAQFLEQIEFLAEVIEIHGHGPHTVGLGDLLHRLQEVAAGHHRAFAGTFQHRFEFLHRHHLHRHLQIGGEFLSDQQRGADVLAGGGHQHPGAATQAPVDFVGEQFAGLLQGAAGIEQPIDALTHLPVDVGQALGTQSRRRLDLPGLLLIAHIDARARHRLDDAIGFQLAVDLADGVAMQTRLHRQLAGARQSVARRVVPGGDRKADLVVQLGRRRDVAFLLDVESHAGWARWTRGHPKELWPP